MFSRKFYEIWSLVNAEWAKFIDSGLGMLKQANVKKEVGIEEEG
jgi:hypothetical protein